MAELWLHQVENSETDAKELMRVMWEMREELDKLKTDSCASEEQLQFQLADANGRADKLREKLQVANDECMLLQQKNGGLRESTSKKQFEYRVVSKPVSYA